MDWVIHNLKTFTTKESNIIEEDDLDNLLGDDKMEEPKLEIK